MGGSTQTIGTDQRQVPVTNVSSKAGRTSRGSVNRTNPVAYLYAKYPEHCGCVALRGLSLGLVPRLSRCMLILEFV